LKSASLADRPVAHDVLRAGILTPFVDAAAATADRPVAQGVLRATLPMFDPDVVLGGDGRPYACPSKFYASRATNSCAPCPDMATSNAGAPDAGGCVPLRTVILAGRDASLSYEARTDPGAGGQANAQPNAVDLMGALKTNASYIKTRGYGLQLHQPINAYSPTVLQAAECRIGLNCFNATALRLQLSALLRDPAGRAGPAPNEVRLVGPGCGGAPASGLPPELCGPWPGLPPLADQVRRACGGADPIRAAMTSLVSAMTARIIDDCRVSDDLASR
jgi:hypothetical protein